MIKDRSDFYSINVPLDQPLAFSRAGFYRLKVQATCNSCGRGFPITMRVNRFTRGGVAGKVAFPDPSDERVISSLVLSACNHGCGSALRANFGNTFEPIFGSYIKVRGPLCLHGLNETCGLCKKEFQPNQKLKWAPHLHTRECPVGQMKRSAEFVLQGSQTSIATVSKGIITP